MKENTVSHKIKISSEGILAILIILFAFQRAFEDVIPVFSYIDESIGLLVLLAWIYKIISTKTIIISKEYKVITLFLLLYLLTNIIGNILYRYQILSSVLIDAFTNLKFYLSIAFTVVFIKKDPRMFKFIPYLAKGLTLFLLLLFVVDYAMDIFPHGYRYGMRYPKLYFGHPTYFAGFLAFLIALLSYYGVKKNITFIFFNIFMMIATLRGKAIGAVLFYILLCFIVQVMNSRLNKWKIVIIGLSVMCIAWQQISFYYIDLADRSARSVILFSSFKVMADYFPIGTGFGTYGSHEAFAHYSPVYDMYGFGLVDELSEDSNFYDDQFWPIVFGQSGFIGTVLYIYILYLIFKKVQMIRKMGMGQYISSAFCFFYLLICSSSEPAFNNMVAVPLGVVIGMTFLSLKKEYNKLQRKP